ncbi:MAG: hypothetical protein WED33_01370, partial [Bacteroidia bacterium]
MVYFSFLFFFLFLATFKYSLTFKVVSVLVLLICCANMRAMQNFKMNEMSSKIYDLREAGGFVEKGNWVLFYQIETNWLMRHAGSYAFAGSDKVVLDNYEAEMDYFPLKWDVSTVPFLKVGQANSGSFNCFKWVSNPSNSIKQVPYVLVFGHVSDVVDTCELKMIQHIDMHYEQVFENNSCTVLKLK